MVRYEKAEDAPEGLLRISIGNDTYRLDDGDSIEAEDVRLIESLDALASLRRSRDQAKRARKAASEVSRAVKQEEKDRAKAEAEAQKHNAEKNPEESAVDAEELLDEKQEVSD